MTNELVEPNQPILEKLVKVNGIAFEEQFVARVIGEFLCKKIQIQANIVCNRNRIHNWL